MGDYKYTAFISYSHKDRAWAKWLHRNLETYKFPKKLVGLKTTNGRVPHNLKPVFRDREELAAGHNLGEKIEAALKASENLIIICSPNAAASHWVNQEILYFKRHNRGAQIFCIIVDGNPYASDIGDPELECFPEGLRFELSDDGGVSKQPAEPLAADIRNNGDGKRLGLLKLISGMVGLGVNDLFQRDLHRARKRVIAITASAFSIVLAMGTLTWTAIDAGKEAEQRRNDAEGQIEFMLTDLKDKLKGVGRLDALNIVGERAQQYYNQYPISDHEDNALGRRARVFHYLGEIQDQLGNLNEAEIYFLKAYKSTEALLVRNPNDPDHVFNHAQSTYWAARGLWQRQEFDDVIPYYSEYLELALKLSQLENNSERSILEQGYAHTNLGSVYYEKGDLDKAKSAFYRSLGSYEKLLLIDPNNKNYQYDYANALAWLSDYYASTADIEKAIEFRETSNQIYESLIQDAPNDFNLKYELILAYKALATLQATARYFDLSYDILQKAEELISELLIRDPNNAEWGSTFAQVELLKALAIKEKENAKFEK